MLRKAKARVVEHRLTNVEGLAVMDAQHLGFQDAVFDVVVAQYVITAVPDPEATLDEFARVIKSGGEIVLVNHLGAERAFAPSTKDGSPPWRAGLAGRRNSAGTVSCAGRRAMAAYKSWSGARCRRSGIFR